MVHRSRLRTQLLSVRSRLCPQQVGVLGGADGFEDLLGLPLVDAAVRIVGVDDVGAAVARVQEGGRLQCVGEAVDIHQLGGVSPVVEKKSEGAARVDGLELDVVADQQHLRTHLCRMTSKQDSPDSTSTSSVSRVYELVIWYGSG